MLALYMDYMGACRVCIGFYGDNEQEMETDIVEWGIY